MKLLIIGALAVAATIGFAADAWSKATSWLAISNSADRYKILQNFNNEALLDQQTGLVWERITKASSFTWQEAYRNCYNATTGGVRGWRLPTTAEILSLGENGSQTIPDAITSPESGEYNLWTSTPYYQDVSSGVYETARVNLAGPKVMEWGNHGINQTLGYLCVRGPH